MTIYLYKKTHNKTGFKYLGKTKRNPRKYKGSGTDWLPHLNEHGNDVSTEILKECVTKEELSYWGRYYGELWNVVESNKWANRIPETGGGGSYPQSKEANYKRSIALKGRKMPDGWCRGEAHPLYGKTHKESSIELMRVKATGRMQTEETKEKRRGPRPGFTPWNKGMPLTSKYSEQERSLKYGSPGDKNPMYGKPVPKKVCPHCNKEVDIRNYSKSHGDRCRFK
jgi:hypothetical protein